MGRINSRNKGANGEREAAVWLQKNFNLEHLPQRNLEQVRFKGAGRVQEGHDLIGFEPFAMEIKRCETLTLRTWWLQAKRSSRRSSGDMVPVVMFRQNRKRWEFLIGANWIGLEVGYIRLQEQEFVAWASKILDDMTEVTSGAPIQAIS